MNRRSIAAAVAAFIFAAPVLAQRPTLMVNPNTGETQEQFAARTRWWREAKFGMFIHWGVYAVPADSTDRAGHKGVGEWYFSNKQAQMKDYEKFAGEFNPVKFDARRWVKTAKDAGMKYIVITTKHHDGFDMFGTKLNRDWNIVSATPYHKDPMAALAAECKRQGVKLCFYHSIMDWHEPDYIPRRPWDTRPADGAQLSKYIDYMKGQLTELLTHYGPIGGIWFDGGWEHSAAELRSAEVNKMIRSLQPGIMINDRNQEPQDYATPEQTIPANALPGGRLWETCMTMNDTWGFAANDTNWKSTDDLIHKLCDIASKGGNFLLNVGPTGLGEFPEAINERLGQIGVWMRANGTSVYGTQKSPFRKLGFDGRCTRKGNRLYLQVFHWPETGLLLSGLRTHVTAARALESGEPLTISLAAGTDSTTPRVIHIGRPRTVDKYATVVELRLAGAPDVVETLPTVRPSSQGVFDLQASEAEIHGSTAQYEQGGGHDNIGYWTNSGDYVTWLLESPSDGRYAVEVTYACEPSSAGSRYTVGVGSGQTIEGAVVSTGSWTTWRVERLGTLTLAPGRHTLTVRATSMPHGAVMNLRRIRLIRE